MILGDPILLLIGAIFLIPAIVIAVPVHELGHAVAAVWMGDPSPRNRGYFKPDPRLFINVYGVLAAFLVNVTWGTRVPVNEYRLSGTGRKLVYALGGPAANLVVAVIAGVALRVLVNGGVGFNPTTFAQPLTGDLATIVYAIYFLNLSTFAFQLLPVPGLDGWRVVETLFRDRNPRFFFNVAANQQTIWIIAAVVVFLSPLLRLNILGWAVAIFFEPAAIGILGSCTSYVSLLPCLP